MKYFALLMILNRTMDHKIFIEPKIHIQVAGASLTSKNYPDIMKL